MISGYEQQVGPDGPSQRMNRHEGVELYRKERSTIPVPNDPGFHDLFTEFFDGRKRVEQKLNLGNKRGDSVSSLASHLLLEH